MLGHILGTLISLSVLASGLVAIIYLVNSVSMADSVLSLVVTLAFMPMALTASVVGFVGLGITTAHFTN